MINAGRLVRAHKMVWARVGELIEQGKWSNRRTSSERKWNINIFSSIGSVEIQQVLKILLPNIHFHNTWSNRSIYLSIYLNWKKRKGKFGLVWFGLVLCHINRCRLFNAKSSLYIYIRYRWFGLVGFYGISTIIGYLMPNPVYTYILNIYDLVSLDFMAYQPLYVI